jgi:hypothetical protein
MHLFRLTGAPEGAEEGARQQVAGRVHCGAGHWGHARHPCEPNTAKHLLVPAVSTPRCWQHHEAHQGVIYPASA